MSNKASHTAGVRQTPAAAAGTSRRSDTAPLNHAAFARSDTVRLQRSLAKAGPVIYTRSGTLGHAGGVPKDHVVGRRGPDGWSSPMTNNRQEGRGGIKSGSLFSMQSAQLAKRSTGALFL